MSNQRLTVFNHILQIIPYSSFQKKVGQLGSDRYNKVFSTWQYVILLTYGTAKQLASLRDIEETLKPHKDTWYHLGLKSVARSTISRQAEKTDRHVLQHTFLELVKEARLSRFEENTIFQSVSSVLALDASTISLCLSAFPWAQYRARKGGIKIHVNYDVRSGIPDFLQMTDAKTHEVTKARSMIEPLEKNSLVVMDRGYLDFELLSKIHKTEKYFVLRLKKNTDRVSLSTTHHSEHLIEHKAELLGQKGIQHLSNTPLRVVQSYDQKNEKWLYFITNNTSLSAQEIADIYRSRWQIELFFKRMKQHLNIKSFFGTSENAVMNQLRASMIYYLILVIIKNRTRSKLTILSLSRMLSSSLFLRAHFIDILGLAHRKPIHSPPQTIPIPLFQL